MKLGEPLLGRQGQGLSARWGGNVLKSFPPVLQWASGLFLSV